MALKGSKVKTDDMGETNPVACPVCGETVKMRLFSTEDPSALSVLILNKNKKSTYAVCPYCASVFSPAANYISYLEEGTACSLETKDLTTIVQGKQDASDR